MSTSKIKKWLKISQENYYILKTEGTVEISGVTYTYSPEDTLYVVPGDYFIATYSEDDDIWNCNFSFEQIKDAYTNGQDIKALLNIETPRLHSIVFLDEIQVVFSSVIADASDDSITTIVITHDNTDNVEVNQVTVANNGGTTYTAGDNIIINNNVISSPDKSYKIVDELPQANIDINTNYLTEKIVSNEVVPGIYNINVYRDSQWVIVGEVDIAVLNLINVLYNTDIVQEEGNSQNKVMSQKAVTDALLNKLESPTVLTNVRANKTQQNDGIPVWTINNNPDYSDYAYKVDLDCQGATINTLAKVIFADEQAKSGFYATTCTTGTDIITIYSNDNSSIVIPVIIYGLPINTVIGNSQHNYSTTEQVVGTYVDGSTLYETTVFYSGTSTISTTTTFAHNISNIDKIISLQNRFANDDTGNEYHFCSEYYPFYIYNEGVRLDNYFNVEIGASNITVTRSTQFPTTNEVPKTLAITIQYTKSTDIINS